MNHIESISRNRQIILPDKNLLIKIPSKKSRLFMHFFKKVKQLPIKKLIDLLQSKSLEVYLGGGAVKRALFNSPKDLKDIDILCVGEKDVLIKALDYFLDLTNSNKPLKLATENFEIVITIKHMHLSFQEETRMQLKQIRKPEFLNKRIPVIDLFFLSKDAFQKTN